MTRFALLMTTALVAAPAMAQEEPYELPTLFLDSAFRDSRELLDTPVAASVVEGEALEVRQADTIEELIGDTPGLGIEGGPRAIAQEPNIRGFQDEQIVLRYDGARFNFNQAHRGRFFIDPDLIQRVEVIRGGGSTLFGSGALGGVISFETKDARDLLEPGKQFGGRIKTGFSSNGDIFTNNLTLYGATEKVDGLVFYGRRDLGDDLDSGNGTDIRNSRVDQRNGLVKIGIEPTEASRFELSLTQYEDEGTTPNTADGASSASRDVDRDARVQALNLSWDYAPTGNDLVDLTARFYVNRLEITEDRLSDARADETNYRTTGFEVVNRSEFDIGVPVDVVYGFEWLRDEQSGTRNGTNRVQFPSSEADTVAVFAEATFALSDSFDLITGLRYDYYERDVDDPTLADQDDDFFSPRIGVSYRPNDNWQIFGNVARAFRAPTLTELFATGTHFATPGFPLGPGTTFTGVNQFIPNPNLRSEKSTQVEIGTRYEGSDVFRSGDKLTFAANAYYADVEDLVNQTVQFIDFSTATPGIGGLFVNGSTTAENIDAELWGFEAEIDYDAGYWFAGASLTLPRGEGENGGAIGSLPQDRLVATFGLRPTDAWTAGARATFTDDARSVPDGAQRTEGYELLDLFATWAPTTGTFDSTVVRFGVDNVFDEEYQIHPNGLSQPGRTYKISASIDF